MTSSRTPRPRPISILACALLLLSATSSSAQERLIRGTVTDPTGGAVANARLVLHTPQGAPVREARSNADGTFAFEALPPGSFWIDVEAEYFESSRVEVSSAHGDARDVRLQLGLAPYQSAISVTAERGLVADPARSTPLVTTIDADAFRRKPLATIGNALTGAVGVMAQQSTYGQVSPFLRGLTGYQVLNLIDGVRFNNATFRSGPNQYLAFADAAHVERVEAMLGPASSQFGSDAMGGTIQIVTPVPQFLDTRRVQPDAVLNVTGGSADRSLGGDAAIMLRAPRVYVNAGGTWRDLQDLRAGGGTDSHHVFRRLFGLTDDQIRNLSGGRQTGTGFSQAGFHAKLVARVRSDQTLTAWYQSSEQRGVRGYKDLWGGLGRRQSEFTPQRLRFFYGRYETLGAGGLDSLTGTISVNAQTDGSVRQGLRAFDPITTDRVGVNALGYTVQATTHVTRHDAVVFGAELYDESVDARRDVTTPLTGAVDARRALYPNGSTYRTTGVFAQDVVTLMGGRVKAVLGGRLTGVRAQTFAADNRTADGLSLGVVDSQQTFRDWTYNLSLTWQTTDRVAINALHGRGFRAPNLNDLGAVGLNDLGYEVPASDALQAGASIGASDGEGVVSSGRSVSRLRAERLMNYELGATARWQRGYARAQVFDAELADPIVRRTLLFPLSSLLTTLAGVPVAAITPTDAQRAQGLASVATGIDPRAVKAFVNDGRTRYRGVDVSLSVRPADRWTVDANYSYLSGHDLGPTRPVRRLPPQQGFVTARYQLGRRLSWIEVGAHMSMAQSALSGGDLTDERIGAARRRTDISDFFQSALVSPYIGPGVDGQFGTPDDVFLPTNETLAQIRDRVLPLGTVVNGVLVGNDGVRVPLFTSTPAFVSVNLGAGLALTSSLRLDAAVMNLFDRNYRIHGSGLDSPGINAFVRLRIAF